MCREIVTHCPRVRILATSREPLRLRAERVWPIPRLSSAAAVELFVERARSARADFDPTADDHLAIQRICEQVDRLPLAIELAAARVRSLSVRDITDRLDDLVELLAGQVDDRAARHQTMQTTIDWSVSSLGPTERQLLDEMVMFAGGARLDAIESVSSTANTTNVLDGLVAKSLVEFDPGRAAADRREPRYLVLEPIRQYVEAELKTTDALELATLHATWVVGLARHASQELASQPAQWTTLLDAETANVAKAFRFLLTAGRVSECMQIVAGLGQYWFSRLSADGYRMSGEVLAAARGDETPRLRAGVLLTAGLLAEQAGDLRQAIDHLACAIELLGPLDTSPRLAWALFHQARVLALSGLADPHRPLGKAVVLFRQLGDPVGEAWCRVVARPDHEGRPPQPLDQRSPSPRSRPSGSTHARRSAVPLRWTGGAG